MSGNTRSCSTIRLRSGPSTSRPSSRTSIGRRSRSACRRVQQRVLSVPELTERLGYTYCFERFAEGLDPEVYQAKGFVRFADETYLFNYVNGRWELEPVLEAETGLVFI